VLNYQSWFEYEYSFSMPAVPAVCLAMGIFRFPVSPRFALIDGKRRMLPDGGDERAWKALRQLRGSDEAADEELNELIEILAVEEQDASWTALWSVPSIRRRVIVANMLQWLQQFTGVNAILSYGPSIFQSANVPLSALGCAIVTNLCNLGATVFMMLVIDKWGRRTLLLIGALSMAVCLALTAVAAHLAVAHHNPLLGWLVLLLVCLYMSAFAISWGGVPWVYPSEIFPMSVKEKAMSTSVFSQWVANFLIAYLVPQQVDWTSVPGTFAFYAVCCAGAFAFVCAFVPETKGLLLEEMGRLFGEPLEVFDLPSHRDSLRTNVGIAGAMSSSCSFASLFGTGNTVNDRMVKSPSAPVPASKHDGSVPLLKRPHSDGGRAYSRPMPVVRSRICLGPGGMAAIY